MNKLERNSNFELMRIISMLLIILGHVYYWGGITKNATEELSNVINIINALILVHVNSYILVSGYFQSTSKFKIRKVIKLFILMWFYRSIFLIIGIILNWYDAGIGTILWTLSPFDFSSYWFVKVYIVLYLISPFLNKAISQLEKKEYQKLLIILFITCSILTTITNQEIFNNLKGYSLVHFIFIYLIGGYLRKYPIKLKRITSIKKQKILYLEIFTICFLLNYIIYRVANYSILSNSYVSFIGKRIVNIFMAYDNPLVVIGSIAYFQFFSLLKIKSKFINKLASPTLEIYMIHETPKLRPIIYTTLGLTQTIYSSYSIIPISFILTIIIYISSSIISIIRKYLFKLINHIFKNNKLINKLKIIENKIDKELNLCKEEV